MNGIEMEEKCHDCNRVYVNVIMILFIRILASSNTTSGIVSDRVYSLDGSEGKKAEQLLNFI